MYDTDKGQYRLTVAARIAVEKLLVESASAFRAAIDAYKNFEPLGGVW
jgi:hypothetical protein